MIPYGENIWSKLYHNNAAGWQHLIKPLRVLQRGNHWDSCSLGGFRAPSGVRHRVYRVLEKKTLRFCKLIKSI